MAVQQEIADKLTHVIKPSAVKWLSKERFKALMATQYIGDGSPDSSTDRYKKLYESYGLANTGKYIKDDIVWVSSNGRRYNRINPVKNNLLNSVYINVALVIEAEASIIMDTYQHLCNTQSYNIGEIDLANYLITKGYVRQGLTGLWKPE